MKIVADTNVLVRAVLGDDVAQSEAARHALGSAERVVIGRHALCEMAWVLRQRYKLPNAELIRAIHGFLNAEIVTTDSEAVEAGLEAMRAGADFADGVIALEGSLAGGEVFVSFDKEAVAALSQLGFKTRLLD